MEERRVTSGDNSEMALKKEDFLLECTTVFNEIEKWGVKIKWNRFNCENETLAFRDYLIKSTIVNDLIKHPIMQEHLEQDIDDIDRILNNLENLPKSTRERYIELGAMLRMLVTNDPKR